MSKTLVIPAGFDTFLDNRKIVLEEVAGIMYKTYSKYVTKHPELFRTADVLAFKTVTQLVDVNCAVNMHKHAGDSALWSSRNVLKLRGSDVVIVYQSDDLVLPDELLATAYMDVALVVEYPNLGCNIIHGRHFCWYCYENHQSTIINLVVNPDYYNHAMNKEMFTAIRRAKIQNVYDASSLRLTRKKAPTRRILHSYIHNWDPDRPKSVKYKRLSMVGNFAQLYVSEELLKDSNPYNKAKKRK